MPDQANPKRLIILDRDGVINNDSREFIKSPEEWVPIAGSIDAIARLSAGGYTVAVASNQSGIARGLFDCQALENMHAKMHALVLAAGGRIDSVFICPHGPDEGCACRKPRAGLLRQVAQYFDADLHGVPVIGDSLRDLQAAQTVAAKPILVRTGNGWRTEVVLQGELQSIPVFDDLAAAAVAILDE